LGGGEQNEDQVFQNKKSMIKLLKKGLPSIGIDKKSDILDSLEAIQHTTFDKDAEDL